MRTYVVQAGDSPARIAARDDMAGCPRCAIDLIRANPHKPAVRHPNGFLSFRELRVGETLWLPDKWFSKELDELPPSYFEALPHPDGVTMPKVQGGALAQEPTEEKGLSKGAKVGLSLLAASALAGIVYLVAFEKGKPRVRRVAPCPGGGKTKPRPRKRPKYAQRAGWYWDPCDGEWVKRGERSQRSRKRRKKKG